MNTRDTPPRRMHTMHSMQLQQQQILVQQQTPASRQQQHRAQAANTRARASSESVATGATARVEVSSSAASATSDAPATQPTSNVAPGAGDSATERLLQTARGTSTSSLANSTISVALAPDSGVSQLGSSNTSELKGVLYRIRQITSIYL